MEIRRILTIVEDNPGESDQPSMRIAAAAAIKNPLIERYDENLEKLLDLGGVLGKVLANRVLQVVGDGQVLSVAKATLVGADSEPEHASALIHHKFGASVTGLLGDVPEILPSTRAQGGPGAILSIRMENASSSDAGFELRLQGSPKPDEIVVALAAKCASSGESPAGPAG